MRVSDSKDSKPGRLEVICGPMFAGKSTLLLRRLRDGGEVFVLIKPAQDDRYAADHVVTHTGQREGAVSVVGPDQIEGAVRNVGLVGVDEGHFFGAGLIAPVLALVSRGVRVVVAGLERDHRGEPFEPFPRLLCEADEVVKLSGACAVCGGPSVHSQRMVASDARIVVGGAEAYQPRCRGCFVPGT